MAETKQRLPTLSYAVEQILLFPLTVWGSARAPFVPRAEPPPRFRAGFPPEPAHRSSACLPSRADVHEGNKIKAKP